MLDVVVELSCHWNPSSRFSKVFTCRMLILEPCKIPILPGSCRDLVLICRIHRPWWVTKAVMETSGFFGDVLLENMYLRCAKEVIRNIFGSEIKVVGFHR